MTKNSNKMKKNNKIRILIIIAIVLIILGLGFGPSLSRYVYYAVHNYYLASKNFYLNSDKLNQNHTEFEIENNWSGAETYPITVNLNSKKNDLVMASSDIQYTVTTRCSDNVTCSLSKSNGTILGTESGGINEDFFIVNVTPAGSALEDGESAWVDITVTSTAPYSDTISGKLYIGVGTEDITYEIMDSPNNPYIEVNITNSLSENKDVTLEFSPNIVLLDMTSDFTLNGTAYTTTIDGHQYVNKIVSNVNALGTVSVKMYKIDATQDYTYQFGSDITPVVTLSYDT